MKKLLVFLLGSLFATAASMPGQAAAQILQQVQGFGSAANSAEASINNCFVQSVAAFSDRVHILCTPQIAQGIGPSSSQLAQAQAQDSSQAAQGIGPLSSLSAQAQAQAQGAGPSPSSLASGAVRYFAVENSVSENAMALTVLSVANAAMQRNRPLTIVYRTNPNQNPGGCLASDCRRIVGVLLN